MKKVLIGLSGGVDSAVSALLLKKSGYEVTGCRLILSDDNLSDTKSTEDVAQRLGIELITADFRDEFKKNVTDYFVSEYLNGRTPNPCIKCNPDVKFASIKKVADRYGFELMATGHYARISKDEKTGLCAIKASPSKKDQSYFLYRLPQEILQNVIFPLGDFETKDQIREIGKSAGFEAAAKKDSQEICFIPDNDYISYIVKNTGIKPVPGNLVSPDGKILGRHTGIINYTVGQRKGLGAFNEPKYVSRINAKTNTVTVCNAAERFTSTAEADNIFWTFGTAPDFEHEYGVKIRSTASAVTAKIMQNGEKLKIVFSSPVIAPCPGQSAVIYDGDTVIGGGYIL